jgi:hypothetical protein
MVEVEQQFAAPTSLPLHGPTIVGARSCGCISSSATKSETVPQPANGTVPFSEASARAFMFNQQKAPLVGRG